jgi:oxalate decarboxylase/phosphoglucose isomerase-like protein (cupin superfamily)
MLYEKLSRKKHVRADGWLVELVSKAYPDEQFEFIHSYLVNIAPACSRAGHFHKKKREWLCVASGRVELTVEDAERKTAETVAMDAQSADYAAYLIPPGVAHILKNPSKSENASVVVFSDSLEDPSDTFPYRFN